MGVCWRIESDGISAGGLLRGSHFQTRTVFQIYTPTLKSKMPFFAVGEEKASEMTHLTSMFYDKDVVLCENNSFGEVPYCII